MATGQAFLVVLMSSVATGIGVKGVSEQSVASIVFFSTVALMAWASWALVTFVIGTLLLPEAETRSDVGELLRTIGFASTPGLLRVLGVLPGVTIPGLRGNRDLDARRDDRRRPAGARLPQHGSGGGRLRARLGAVAHAGHPARRVVRTSVVVAAAGGVRSVVRRRSILIACVRPGSLFTSHFRGGRPFRPVVEL